MVTFGICMDNNDIEFHEIWFTKFKKPYQNFYFALTFPSSSDQSILENDDSWSWPLGKEVAPSN